MIKTAVLRKRLVVALCMGPGHETFLRIWDHSDPAWGVSKRKVDLGSDVRFDRVDPDLVEITEDYLVVESPETVILFRIELDMSLFWG